MKLGILVNTDKCFQALSGITRAASDKGHEVTIFAMDEGTRLLEDPECLSLSGLARVSMSYCDHSAIELGVNKEGVPEAIERSSQYNNAAMNHNADKVIVL
ncbi:MAG: DsrE family protein [Proteobacteria bacterium]|nr:DsrE family protein [Pseudomonadota bacterium]MBU1736928.1 DsrE family protein [Pseudomonadota bacterium]